MISHNRIPRLTDMLLDWTIALVGLHGLFVVVTTFIAALVSHHGESVLLASLTHVNLWFGLTLIYLWSLLRRYKYNAWLLTLIVYVFVMGFNAANFPLRHLHHDLHPYDIIRAVVVPGAIVVGLVLFRGRFTVRSDIRGFKQAVRISLALLMIMFAYGVTGFSLLDDKDFHEEISVVNAMHRTVDQLDFTTSHPVHPYTRRSQVFLDSLSVGSFIAVAYAFIAFFQPLRNRYVHARHAIENATRILEIGTGTSEDFFKLWPHDKSYEFSPGRDAALAYKVQSGIALVAGEPFGKRTATRKLIGQFDALCFTNDWLPAFVYVRPDQLADFKAQGYAVQLIGREAVVDVAHFMEQVRRNKYFRQISNRFDKLSYTTELLVPPHGASVLQRLRTISDDWLEQPGRAERGFMLGYFSEAYLQQCPILVARDDAGTIMAFLNQVPSYDADEANFDMLRHAGDSPGNSNDFLLMALIAHCQSAGIRRLNLGLCPLAGISESDDTTLISNTMRFIYANGNRLYSFKGLERFKAKYEPVWNDRYIVYKGGVRGFARTLRALTLAMRIKR